MADYLIAIGGTGARVAESVIHLCECGFFSSDTLKLLIIDADENNGNKLTSEKLIDSYRMCRKYYHKDGEEGSALFKTDIQPVFIKGGRFNDDKKQTFSISPVSSEEKVKSFKIENDLVKISNPSREAINLMKALYSKDDYTRDIKGGFYAHPPIGALMFERWIEESSEQIDGMLDSIKQDVANDHVHIFIVASSFGGTGASGFPTVARMFRESLAQRENHDKVHVSGCFVLPYFNVENQGTGNRIDFTTFNESAKNSIKYYEEHESTLFFDKIYVLGSDENIIRGTHCEGGKEQKNWPHYIELYAAMAADHYFNEKDTKRYNENTVPEWLGFETHSNGIANLSWNDFPRGGELKQACSEFLMFNLMYVPCILHHFLDVDETGDETIKFKTKPTEQINWRPILTKDFGEYSLGGRFTFHKSFNEKSFSTLYEHFNFHIKWLYRLLCRYETANSSENIQYLNREMKGLFGDDDKSRSVFERRYKMALETDDRRSLYQNEQFTNDNIELYSFALGDSKIEILEKAIYSRIDQMKRKKHSIGVNKAVASIIQDAYRVICELF